MVDREDIVFNTSPRVMMEMELSSGQLQRKLKERTSRHVNTWVVHTDERGRWKSVKFLFQKVVVRKGIVGYLGYATNGDPIFLAHELGGRILPFRE